MHFTIGAHHVPHAGGGPVRVHSGSGVRPIPDFTPVTDAMLRDPAPEDWLVWRGPTLDGWGYSSLNQIDRDNVGQLRMVWSRSLGPGAAAGDAARLRRCDVHAEPGRRHPGARRRYRRHPLGVPARLAGRSRGLHARRGHRSQPQPRDLRHAHIIDTSGDDYVFALDAATGELAWETQILDYRVNPANQRSGPIVADGKIVSGRDCTPQGGPNACVIVAYDATTGEELWRRRTIPAPGEPGDERWGGVPFEERKHVGAWMVPSYDPS